MTANLVVQGQLVEGRGESQVPGTFWWVAGVRRGSNPENAPVNTLPGDAFTIVGLHFVCPGGCGAGGYCRIDNPQSEERGPPRWSWNGERQRPTLRPSILRPLPMACGWHGYLTDGVFTPCDDSRCPGVPPTPH